MNFPKLKTRPRSTHTVYSFGGLWHSGEAPVGMTNGTTMRWDNLSNLGPDHSPMLSTVKDWSYVNSVDGCQLTDPVIGVADGEHPVFLDEKDTLWCYGNTFTPFMGMADPNYPQTVWKQYKQSVAYTAGTATITDGQALYNYYTPTRRKTINLRYRNGNWWDGNTISSPPGITLTHDTGHPQTGDTLTIAFKPYYADTRPSLVRIGAYILETKTGAFVNVEKLANGAVSVYGRDYGTANACQINELGVGDTITLTLCQMDGTPYTGAVAQTTPPSSHTNVWIDTSGNNAVAMEWSESYSTWVAIPSTYVLIETVHISSDNSGEYGVLAKGDGVKFTMTGGSALDSDVKNVLNNSHVLVDVWPDGTGSGAVIVPGTLPAATVTVTDSDLSALTITRTAPVMDFVVECDNRLWGCRYYVSGGTLINEIYASALGDFRNWSVYEGLSTDSWTASRGTPAPFTGAAVLSGHPLFFREESVEKVYPSSTGAHQIQTYSIDGVQEGSDRSLVVIDELLYYQSRLGVCVYDGTMPKRIGAAFGDLKFSQGIAARHLKRYCISMVQEKDGERIVGVYDIATGEWYLEGDAWDNCAFTWKDELYYVFYSPITSSGQIVKRYATADGQQAWIAESGVIGYELPEHRFISCIRIRGRSHSASGTDVTLKIMYDDSGTWITKGTWALTKTGSKELNVFPRRCDHFRLRIEGSGGADILSMSFRMERSDGGH